MMLSEWSPSREKRCDANHGRTSRRAANEKCLIIGTCSKGTARIRAETRCSCRRTKAHDCNARVEQITSRSTNGWHRMKQQRQMERSPTICDGEPSILFFDLKVTQTLALCPFLFSVHVILLFAGLRALFDILLLGWGVRHDVGLRVTAAA